MTGNCSSHIVRSLITSCVFIVGFPVTVHAMCEDFLIFM